MCFRICKRNCEQKEGCKPSHAICFGFLPVFVPTYCKLAWGRECTVHVQMNQHKDERTHTSHRKLVRHKTSRRHAWGEGIWNFYVERLFCCFSSISQSFHLSRSLLRDSGRKPKVKRRNRLGTTIDQVD